jgi:hypothetical protein
MKINIFGSSEKLEEMGAAKIARLLSSKTPSIGINHFPNHYPNVDCWLFVDGQMVERMDYKGQKIITCEFVYNNYLEKKPKYNVIDRFEPNNIQGSIGNSAFYAIWWAVKEGYTNINLYGILDGEYKQLANGNTAYKNIFSGEHIFQDKKYQKFKEVVETGYYGKAKICRPLLKCSDVQIESKA